jgi:hypothetical protein
MCYDATCAPFPNPRVSCILPGPPSSRLSLDHSSLVEPAVSSAIPRGSGRPTPLPVGIALHPGIEYVVLHCTVEGVVTTHVGNGLGSALRRKPSTPKTDCASTGTLISVANLSMPN